MEPEATVSALELLDRQRAEEIAAAQLEARRCTYSRASPAWRLGVSGIAQSVVCCRTCSPPAVTAAFVGLCEACAFTCHEGHELIELGLRRDFRCDCATERCAASAGGCLAQPQGMPTRGLPANTQNEYLPRQNWAANRFCSCAREYDAERDTLVQCIACDEWLHDVHIPGFFEAGGARDTLVCAPCVQRLPYLASFSTFTRGVCVGAVEGAGASAAAASPVAPAASASPVAAALSSSSSSAATASGSSPAAAGMACAEPFFPLQPWVCCLTCTGGADDGRGVCMACAEACHKGHVLTGPRIAAFSCDCGTAELLGGSGCGLRAPPPTSLLAAPVEAAGGGDGTASAGVGLKRARPEEGQRPATETRADGDRVAKALRTEDGHGAIATLGAAAVLPAGHSGFAWCSGRQAAGVTAPLSTLVPVHGAAFFLDSVESLCASLCRCEACMRRYAADGVSSWFFGEESDEVAAPDCECWLAAGAAASTSSPASTVAATTSAATSSAATAASASSGGGDGEGAAPPGFASLHDRGVAALAQLPYTQQLDALRAYNGLERELMPFLRGFAASGRAVTAGDIRTFFMDLKSRQRRHGGVGGEGEG